MALLLLDNESLLRVLNEGCFKFQPITFEDAKGILETMGSHNMIRCFKNSGIEHIIYEHLGIDKQNYPYKKVDKMEPGQDGLIFRLYETESETSPIIKTELGNEAKKIQNIYVYCELISRIDMPEEA